MTKIIITLKKAKAAIIRIVPTADDKRVEAAAFGLFLLLVTTMITLYSAKQQIQTTSKATGVQPTVTPSLSPTSSVRLGTF